MQSGERGNAALNPFSVISPVAWVHLGLSASCLPYKSCMKLQLSQCCWIEFFYFYKILIFATASGDSPAICLPWRFVIGVPLTNAQVSLRKDAKIANTWGLIHLIYFHIFSRNLKVVFDALTFHLIIILILHQPKSNVIAVLSKTCLNMTRIKGHN